jgi:hypothetical protein
VPPLSGVDIENGFNVRLTGSQITMDDLPTDSPVFSPFAAVVALGNGIWIEDNQIGVFNRPGGRAGPSAWGGIQLRGKLERHRRAGQPDRRRHRSRHHARQRDLA